jgi:hypothetical protein
VGVGIPDGFPVSWGDGVFSGQNPPGGRTQSHTGYPDGQAGFGVQVGAGVDIGVVSGHHPPGGEATPHAGFSFKQAGGTHLRRDTVIPQWFQASKAAARKTSQRQPYNAESLQDGQGASTP